VRIKSFEFAHIKAFKALRFDLDRTAVLIGQNDHGKSSILKVLDIVLNQLDEESLAQGSLHPDLAERLLPIFPVSAKARRVTVSYEFARKQRQLHITVRSDLTFTVLEKIARNAKTTPAAIEALRKLRESNRFVLIPALRDASSAQFQDVFGRMLREHGLSTIIPQKAGGTPREYRALKDIRDKISTTIKPFIDDALLPKIEQHFGFETLHKLALKFDVDVRDVGEWILGNLRLGFSMTDDGATTLALSEAGSGVQSGVLLALHRLEQKASESPDVQFILAIEEPEAFLHPQKQKELYCNIRSARSENLRVLVTTHSPYIVAETPYTTLGLVKKDGQYSALHVAAIANKDEGEIFDAYCSELNSALLFANKVVLVEGESDERVLRLLLQTHLGNAAHGISVVSAAGNRNFSPYLRMIRAWGEGKMPHLVVTDFDSLTTSTGRAIQTGAKAAGVSLVGEATLNAKVDAALDHGEAEFSAAAKAASETFGAAGLPVFVFSSDLERTLITSANKEKAIRILNESSTTGADYSTGYDLVALRRLIGSKGIPLNPANDPPFKKPYLHRKLAQTIDLANPHPDIARLLAAIDAI